MAALKALASQYITATFERFCACLRRPESAQLRDKVWLPADRWI